VKMGRQTVHPLALSSIMLIVLLTGAIWSPLAATAATYYVATTGNDANPGTQAQPFRTIRKGLTVLRAGDTLYLRGGTYNEGINAQNQTVPSGTSWSNAVTIAGYPGEDATLRDGINLYVPTGLLQYVIFDNFILDGRPYSALGPGLQHIRFQNSEVKNNSGSGVGGGFQDRYLEYINLHVHHNGTDRLDHGFYVCTKNTIIRDCDIHDNTGYGLQFFDSGNLHCGDDSAIYNNKIHHNHGDGGATINYSDNMQFYNNLIYNNDNYGASFSYGNSDNVQIYNNTIYNNGGSALGLGSNCHGCESALTNAKVRNNIFYGHPFDGVRLEGGTTGVTYSNNLCSSLQNGCTVTGAPMFTNPGGFDFTLQAGSPAIDAGISLSTVPTDFSGISRTQGTGYDIGAYEYQGFQLPAPKTLRIISVVP